MLVSVSINQLLVSVSINQPVFASKGYAFKNILKGRVCFHVLKWATIKEKNMLSMEHILSFQSSFFMYENRNFW